MPANKYYTSDGVLRPGVTTLTGQLNKPALLRWVAKVTKEGKDYEEERDSAGDRGTDVHDMIMRFWKGEEVAMVGDIQTRCFERFLDWLEGETILPILLEQPLISEKLGFGGQFDLFAEISRKHTLLDVKTSKAIYENNWYQLAGYDILLREHGYKPKQYAILRLGQDGSFEYVVRTELKKERRIFKHLLGIYYERRQ